MPLTSQPFCPELDQHFPVRPCEAEEANHRLVWHTLNLIHNGCKNILVCTIDTNVLVLLIWHIGWVELGNVHIHAYLVNSEIYYGIRTIIQELYIKLDICCALLFFYALSGCNTVSSFFGQGKCKVYDVLLKSSQKDDLTEVFIQLAETPVEVTPNMMNVFERKLCVGSLWIQAHHTWCCPAWQI